MKTILLVDGNPLMWRAAYGRNEGYVAQGIVKYFFEAVEMFDCSEALLFWDSGKSRWRSDYYPEYKAQREDKKLEFDLEVIGEQKRSAQEYLGHLGVRNITVHGVEADDLIAWFAQYFYKTALFQRIIIVTRDRDLWQLINDGIHIFDPFSGKLIDPMLCMQDFGVSPQRIIDYKALVGDASDNLKGVKGIGEKTAKKLIEKYGGIEGFLNLDNKKEISKSKISKKLLDQSEDLELTYQLVRLPSLEESWSYLNEEEGNALYGELTKRVTQDPLNAQIEAEIIGCMEVDKRAMVDLENEIKGIMSYLYAPKFPKVESLTELDEIIKRCRACPLHACCSGYGSTLPEGYADAEIMILGRNPGQTELVQGRPFVGRAGERLDRFLEEIGLTRRQCWITNVCKCFSTGNRPPTYGEISACSNFLRVELELIKPKMIICFGNEAMGRVTPYKAGVTKHAGEILEKPTSGLGQIDAYVGIMVHPSSALRSTQGEANFQYGTDKIKEFLESRRR